MTVQVLNSFILAKENTSKKCSGQQEPEYSQGHLCKALGSWGSGNLEGRGGLGKGWVKVGQFISNLGLRWTFLSQLEGAK